MQQFAVWHKGSGKRGENGIGGLGYWPSGSSIRVGSLRKKNFRERIANELRELTAFKRKDCGREGGVWGGR
jgi:hypothetical protein